MTSLGHIHLYFVLFWVQQKMGGGGRPYEIPDWRKYKVEDAPELVNVRNALAQKGLKDPWLR